MSGGRHPVLPGKTANDIFVSPVTFGTDRAIDAVVAPRRLVDKGFPASYPRPVDRTILVRFASKKTVTIDTAVPGGNASLLALEDE